MPDKSKFHLPERPKFHFPDKSRFHLPDKSKFIIKKPSIRLADALARVRRPPSLREQQKQRSTESTAGSRRNIFDFATYPRIFDKKSKKRGEYATSSPKDSRAQSAESATFPRTRKRKSLTARWTRHFGNSSSQDRAEAAASDGSPPWHQTSLDEPQEPRLSARTEEEIMAAARAIPWEDTRKCEQRYDDEEIQYMDYEQESSQEVSDLQPPPRRSHKASRSKQEKSYEEPMEEDPRLYGDEEVKYVYRDEVEVEEEDHQSQDDWHADEQVVLNGKFKPIPRSRSLDENMPRALEEAEYEGAFMAVDPRRFGSRKTASQEEEEHELEEEEEEHEPSSAQSDREQQQSSGSSCDRRRRGVIEEIDSDEFFLRASGISQDDMNLGSYLPDEIRDALRAEIVSALQDEEMPPIPPQRPMRMRSLRKRKEEDSTEATKEVVPPVRPKRERGPAAARRSREASIVDEVFRERTRSDSRSDSRHRVVYQAEGAIQLEPQEQEPLDDIVVVKPVRRKSRSSLRSQSQPPMETSILSPSMPAIFMPTIESSSTPFLSTPPVVPIRRKRSHRETMVNQRNGAVVPICNGHRDWEMESTASKKPMTPVRRSRSRQSSAEQQQLVAEGDMVADRENIEKLIGQKNLVERTPVPPKRRSRSRATSVAADEDRTSHGAESLPEAGYVQEDIPPDETSSARDLSGYAIVEKREKPPRPPPPRRRRDKFATTPRPIPPKRPQRAYSTLGPATRSRPDSISDTIASETITATAIPTLLTAAGSTPYVEIDTDDVGLEHRDALRSGKVLNKIQGRPLPAPPRPPRSRKDHSIVERPRTPFEFAEMTAATQTDPLPDDMVIEEEITQAKLIMTPSRSGSQVMVSMERIPSPSRTGTPPVPPLPLISQILRKEQDEEEEEQEDEIGRMAYDTVSLTSPSPRRETERASRHMSAPHLEERREEEELRARAIRSALLSDEPLRISSLEVGDLKVDRLSVSQIEAHKIMASEVDAMVIAASELRGVSTMEESLSPAIIRELIAIRSHLETVATSQARERHHESEKEEPVSHRVTDIPTSEDDNQVAESRERQSSQGRQEQMIEEAPSDETVETMPVELPSVEDEEMIEAGEDQKVVKTDVFDIKDKEAPHTFSVTSPLESSEFPLLQTLMIDQLESTGKDKPTTHPLTVTAQDIQDTQDKSLRILDSEHPLTLSSRTTSDSHVVDESRASFPPSSDVPTTRSSELKVSAERAAEPPSSSDQTTTTTTSTSTTITTTATEPTTTSTCLRGSDKDDVSDSKEQLPRKSRSRSPSPARGIMRQTASPVRSLPPVISVTPDTPDPTSEHGTDAQAQRAVISYSSDAQHDEPKYVAQPQRAVISHSSDTSRPLQTEQRESSQSPVPSFPLSTTHFIAFPASEIPAQFFSLSETPTSQRDTEEPGVIDTTQQLLRALRTAGIKAMRHFVRYLASTLSTDDTVEKVREVELAICVLLLFIAGLLIYYFSSTRTVTYYHHWDYFNPPQ